MVIGTRFGTTAIILQLHGPEQKFLKEKFLNVQPLEQPIDF